jgi:hypothetical protein
MEKYICKKCDFKTDNASDIANHYKYSHTDQINLECGKCGKILKNSSGLTNHTKRCKGPKEKKECPKCKFIIKSSYNKHYDYCDGNGPRRMRDKKERKSWNKGLTKENDERIKKMSDKLKSNIPKKHTEETKLLLSEIIKKRYENGWESKAGRCKKIDYHSNIAGDIKVDGKWELNVAIYLDSIGVKWVRNKKRFKYNNTIKECISTYCPDFYVYDWDTYIEVKGYKTELDQIKWSQFKHNLEIWDKEKLLSLNIKIYGR